MFLQDSVWHFYTKKCGFLNISCELKTPARKYNKEENSRCVVTHVYAFVFRIDRKKDKTERKILDSQERAFWDVHRPVVKLFLNDEAFQVLTGKF